MKLDRKKNYNIFIIVKKSIKKLCRFITLLYPISRWSHRHKHTIKYSHLYLNSFGGQLSYSVDVVKCNFLPDLDQLHPSPTQKPFRFDCPMPKSVKKNKNLTSNFSIDHLFYLLPKVHRKSDEPNFAVFILKTMNHSGSCFAFSKIIIFKTTGFPANNTIFA